MEPLCWAPSKHLKSRGQEPLPKSAIFYLPSLFPAPLTFWTLSICPHLGHPHPHAGPVKCHSSNQLPPGLPDFSVWLALTLPSPGADLPRALTHVSFLAPARCPQPQPVTAHSHRHVEPQVLATRTRALQLQSEPSLGLASVPLFLPLVGDREETDWGHKTHQVFNRWLSENGMPTQQLAAAGSMVAGLRQRPRERWLGGPADCHVVCGSPDGRTKSWALAATPE